MINFPTRYTVRGRGAMHSSRPWETLMRQRFYDFSLERQIIVTPRILFSARFYALLRPIMSFLFLQRYFKKSTKVVSKQGP